jgi:hypothetical protein
VETTYVSANHRNQNKQTNKQKKTAARTASVADPDRPLGGSLHRAIGRAGDRK